MMRILRIFAIDRMRFGMAKHGTSSCLSLHSPFAIFVEDRLRFGKGNQTSLLPLHSPFTIFADAKTGGISAVLYCITRLSSVITLCFAISCHCAEAHVMARHSIM